MKKLMTLVALVCLTVFTLGCESPAEKKADANKKAMQADTDAAKAEQDAEAKKADADMDAEKAVEDAGKKKADAAQEAADADRDEK